MISARENPVLVFEDVSVRYRGSGKPALDHCSFSIMHGEKVALLGLNGSGKSTLLLASVGMVPFSGTIIVDGEELIPSNARKLRRKIGFLFPVPHDQILLPVVLEDVAFTAACRGYSREDSLKMAREALRKVGAEDLEMASPYELSHGQRLRVALAGAMVPLPSILLLDEPTGGLDPRGRAQLARLIRELPCAVFAATHDLPFAKKALQRFLFLEEGRLVKKGTDFREVERVWELDSI